MSSFCALGYRIDPNHSYNDWADSFVKEIQLLGFKTIANNFEVDFEVSPGLIPFCQNQKIDQLLYIDTEKRRKIGPNSSEVFVQLGYAQYGVPSDAPLVASLLHLVETFPGTELYLFLAFEWTDETYSRFITSPRATAKDLVYRHYEYFYTLFNSHTGRFSLDSDTPTVFKFIA